MGATTYRSDLVELSAPLASCPELLEVEAGLAGSLDGHLLPTPDLLRGLEDVADDVERNDYRSVLIGVNQVAVAYAHASYRDRPREVDQMHESVRGNYPRRQHLEPGSNIWQIANRSVGHQSRAPEAGMNGAVDLS